MRLFSSTRRLVLDEVYVFEDGNNGGGFGLALVLGGVQKGGYAAIIDRTRVAGRDVRTR